MENLKIRVTNEAENKEVQELFFELGYEKGAIADYYPSWISNFHEFTLQERKYTSEPADHWLRACKEITLPELRDIVVLKRNNVGDATHKGSITDNVYYVSSDEEVYRFESSAWCFSTVIVADLKPIEKKEMKEYLDKQQDGTYKLIEADSGCVDRDWIEIPEGSETFNYYDRKDNLFFLKGSGKDTMFSNDLNDWDWKKWGDIDFDGVVCLWSRHTNPEELPFVDDEPSQSLNDQYAEIETVRQTLSQRQEQYGSFEDVAMITEQMVDVMRKGYYENLAYNQKMALYMICSKMARIVNGNPNHKDSWHDIAGYATLIDNELVSEKDMPF